MMNMQVEHTTDGGKRFVHVSRSGRRYRGATTDEVERKTLLAALHALKRTIDNGRPHNESIAVEMCARLFVGICSFGDLTVEQMRELKQVFVESLRVGERLEKAQRLEPAATEKQLKKIKALGLYSIVGTTYGRSWIWKKLKEWVVRYRDTEGRIDLNDLTQQEAWYVIKRLERIEQRLLAQEGA